MPDLDQPDAESNVVSIDVAAKARKIPGGAAAAAGPYDAAISTNIEGVVQKMQGYDGIYIYIYDFY